MGSDEGGNPDWSDYSDVLGNREYDVVKRVNALVPETETTRTAVGYFYLGGFDLPKENLRSAEHAEILIGTDADQRTIDELERGFVEDLEEYDHVEAQEGINRLYELIQKEKVDVRVYGDSHFHPELYLFEHPAGSPDLGRAVIGSPSLSASGLRGNVELNVEKKDNNTIRYLDEWFEEIREGASKFDKDLMFAEIEESQFGEDLPGTFEEGTLVVEVEAISPHEATKWFIIEQFSRNVREGTLLQDITGDYEEQLTASQQDAFRAVCRPLEKYNGVVLAGGVGLGRSYIGAPLVQECASFRDDVLIIVPNRLEWMQMRDLLDADTGESPTIAEKTFMSFNKLPRLSEKETQRLRGVDLILVDEAYNLRNTGIQRYDKLQSTGRKGKKFVMLIVTPIHNFARDVDNPIKVFVDDDDFDTELKGLSPSEIFKQYDHLPSEEDKSAGTQSRLPDLEELIESIMREVIISRDWKYILENYEEVTIGDRATSIPDRNPCLITPDDFRLDELYSDTVDTVIESDDSENFGLNTPYVSVDRYDADGDEEGELIIEYQNASILMLINPFKRPESSLAAFETSVERLMEQERITRHIATGDLDDTKNRSDAIEQIRDTFEDDSAKDTDSEEVAEALNRVSPSKRDKIVADTDEDLQELGCIERQAQNALQTKEDGCTKDAKAERLRGLIDRELSDEKVLIFSQHVPMITHLFEQLTGEDPAHTNVVTLGQDSSNSIIGFVHGGSRYDERTAERFAPEAQEVDVTPGEEIDILFATNVLGVGPSVLV